MKDSQVSFSIKTWAEEDRPREKLLDKGRLVLTDAELIAILIGSGNRTESAVQLSQRILALVNNNLNELGKLTPNDLVKLRGIGQAKAVTIVAALELGRRRKEVHPEKRNKVTCSKDVYDYLKPHYLDLPHEEFGVLLLNRSNTIIRKEIISRGGVAGTVVDTKLIFKPALELLATSVILCHNHPSGNLKPSNEDIKITRKIKEAGILLDIPVQDHVIVTDNGYYSFADEEMI